MSSDQLFWPAAVQTLKARLVFQPKQTNKKKKHKHIKMASFFFFKRTMNNVIKTYKNLFKSSYYIYKAEAPFKILILKFSISK